MLKFTQEVVATISYLIRLIPNWLQSLIVALVGALLQAWISGQVSFATLGTWIYTFCFVWITTHAAEIFASFQKAGLTAHEAVNVLSERAKQGESLSPQSEEITPDAPLDTPPVPFNTSSGPF